MMDKSFPTIAMVFSLILTGVVIADQPGEGQESPIAVKQLCVRPVATTTVVANPADIEVMQGQVIAMAHRLGYEILDKCDEASPAIETSLGMDQKKDYSSFLSSGSSKIEYVVLRLVVRYPGDAKGWEAQFDEQYRPGKVQKIASSLLARAERKLAKAIRKQQAKGAKP